jgi:1,4-alpha-glucan branching enzyme
MPLLHGCREAQLVGDFNNWDGSKHKMTKDSFGVWSIKISHVDGKPAIPHNSKVKFRFRHGRGGWVDRIPAWIRYATVDASKFGAPYDGVHWDPPTSERYTFSGLKSCNHEQEICKKSRTKKAAT